MSSFEELTSDVRGRAVRLLLVASACTVLVAGVSGMAHKWDDPSDQPVSAPVFAKMATLPARDPSKVFTDPAAPADATPTETSPVHARQMAAAAPVAPPSHVAAPAPIVPQTTPLVTVSASQPDGDAAAPEPDETASIAPEPPQRRKAEALSLKVPGSVRIRSGSTFTIGSDTYRIEDPETVTAESCKRRSRGCTRRPMRSLKQAIAGATLQCTSSKDGGTILLSDCSKTKAAGRSRRAGGGKRVRLARR